MIYTPLIWPHCPISNQDILLTVDNTLFIIIYTLGAIWTTLIKNTMHCQTASWPCPCILIYHCTFPYKWYATCRHTSYPSEIKPRSRVGDMSIWAHNWKSPYCPQQKRLCRLTAYIISSWAMLHNIVICNDGNK